MPNQQLSRLRIIEKGWEGYNGFFGNVEFENGVSKDAVASRDADMLMGLVRCEIADGDFKPINEVLVDRAIAAPVMAEMHRMTEAEAAMDRLPKTQRPEEAVKRRVWVEKELVAIADKEGIRGLRAISVPLNVNDRSVPGLIDKILKKQAGLLPAKIEN